jgi:hypothetical protein
MLENSLNYSIPLPNKTDEETDVADSLKAGLEIIDTELKNRKDELDQHKNASTAHSSSNISHGDDTVEVAFAEVNERMGDLDNRVTETANSAVAAVDLIREEFDLVVAEAGSNNPEVVQARGSEVNLNSRLDKVDSSLAQSMTLIEDNATKPESFSGNDYQKLQQAFDYAISQNKPLQISKTYNIGANTIIINKGSDVRIPLYVFGGGKIKKDTDGFIFNAPNVSTSDIIFDNMWFEGLPTKQVMVFDCGGTTFSNLVRVSTNKCCFLNVHTIFYSNLYVQTIKMLNDTIIGCTNAAFDVQGMFNVVCNGVLMEASEGSFLKHSGIGSGLYKTLNNVVVKDSCLEGFNYAPVFLMKNTLGLTIDNCYFEGNDYGTIIFDSNATLKNINISNNHHEGAPDYTSLITWGKTLVNCNSFNNSAVIPVHDTTNVTSGKIISLNDYSTSATPNIELDSSFLYIAQDDMNVIQDKNLSVKNMITDSSFETDNYWAATNATVTRKTDTPYSGISYMNVVGTANNGYMWQGFTDLTVGDKFMIYLVSRGQTLEPFSVKFLDKSNGNVYDYLDFYPTKTNQWEVFCLPIAITNALTAGNVRLILYPKQSNNSMNASRDFDQIAVYKVPKAYDGKSFARHVGYSVQYSGLGINKLDSNNDGVVDIPYGSTGERPKLTTKNTAFPYFDTQVNKFIMWNGTAWKDTNNINLDSIGINTAVSAAATSLSVTFATPEPNAAYAVSITPFWNTTYWLTVKTATGFTINFGTAPSGASNLDWTIKR